MKVALTACLAVPVALIGVSAAAQPVLPADEAAILPRIVQAVQVDISDEYIGAERAILLASGDPDASSADLVILVGAPDERVGQPIAIGRNLLWMGQMAGQIPQLEVTSNHGLKVRAEQIGIGRNAWEETLTLAEREGEIRIAGYTLKQWDRLTAASATCDWNLLTGRWVQDISPSADSELSAIHKEGGQPAHYLLSDWRMDDQGWPDFCAVDLDEY